MALELAKPVLLSLLHKRIEAFFFFFGFIMCISREAPFFKGTLDVKSSSSHPKALLRRRNVTRTQEVNYFSSLCNMMAKVTVKSQTRSSLLCLLF